MWLGLLEVMFDFLNGQSAIWETTGMQQEPNCGVCVCFSIFVSFSLCLCLTHCDLIATVWLVVWNINFIFPYIGLLIIPIDVHIFQRGGPTTNQQCLR